MLTQFSRTELLLGKEAMDRLKNVRVAVFGIGGVAATNFAFTGILAFSGWLGCVNFPMYCVGIVVAIALGFGITAFLLKSGKVKEYN